MGPFLQTSKLIAFTLRSDILKWNAQSLCMHALNAARMLLHRVKKWYRSVSVTSEFTKGVRKIFEKLRKKGQKLAYPTK